MPRGGRREGSGRKRIGNIINMRIGENVLIQIDQYIEGSSRAEKIRKCIEEGLKNYTDGGKEND